MLNEGNFRKTLLDIIDNPDNYTKDQLYDAFLEVTERYLDEMVSTLNYERNIIAKLGKEKGEEEIERIAASNPALNDLEQTNVIEPDRAEAIRNLIDFIACEFGLSIDGGDEK